MRYPLIALIASQLLIAQNDSIAPSDEGWKRGGNATFLFNQSAFSEWASGGQNSISLSFHTDYDISFKKNGWNWDTKFLGDFGLTKITGTKFLRKTNDRIDLQSFLGKSFSKEWSYSTVFGVKTQFARGYTFGKDSEGEETRSLRTQFLSCIYSIRCWFVLEKKQRPLGEHCALYPTTYAREQKVYRRFARRARILWCAQRG